MSSRRIYPIDLKPASKIRSWKDWPEDVADRLHEWNGGHRGLSFNGSGVFKCPDCEQFCEPQPYGTATIHKVPICDDCLIARARRANEKASIIELNGRPDGCGSCICYTPAALRQAREEGIVVPILPNCGYHAAAAADPHNHSIPWNCPTYWDGCNCTLPQNNAP